MNDDIEIQIIAKQHFPQILKLVAEIPVSAEFYWPQDHLLDELESTRGIGLWKKQQLCTFVLWRDLYDAHEISVLATTPQMRGQGYMSRLMREALTAHSQKSQWWLEVHEKNLTAQKLYLKLGFIESGRRQNYYRDGGTALLYTFTIKTT